MMKTPRRHILSLMAGTLSSAMLAARFASVAEFRRF